MPAVERSARIAADPETLRWTLATIERWPGWCGFLRKVAPAAAEGGPEGDWSIVALLGTMPFSAFARLTTGDERVSLETLTSTGPVTFARYTFSLAPDAGGAQRVTLRVDYAFARGPGGWLVDRFMVRRRLAGQLDDALAGLARVVGGAPGPPV